MRRAILIAICLVLFIGLIVYSAGKVRYSFMDKPARETTITEKSLTHEVERGKDGKLEEPAPEEQKEQPGKGKACPT
jgi:hypothetical protein